nr:uncharacterized protein LOC111511934 [Leptinotarsa decemlineata]XP_023023887.1 uncharacterized protein LOC111511934 [Leptinotarsa decemlineata]
MRLLVLVALLSAARGEQLLTKKPIKRSYVCPPNFIRQGRRCYFFSKDATTWQEALYHCRELHSHLTVIRNPVQDKLVRSFLSQKSLDPVERWLGGVYDWANMTWKWAASGKPLGYNGFVKFDKEENKEKLRWHCLIMDPSLDFRWNSRSCFEKKHYMCHTKLKIVTNKDKRKLKHRYRADESNKLNEIPVPSVAEFKNSSDPLKPPFPITYKFEINRSLNDQAMFAYTPKALRRVKKNKKRKARKILAEGLVVETSKGRKKSKRKKVKPEDLGEPTLIRNIRWRTYKKKNKRLNSLYPPQIVEEYNYVKG